MGVALFKKAAPVVMLTADRLWRHRDSKMALFS